MQPPMTETSSPIIKIIFQDKYIIAIHKPAGLLVHKSPIDKHETRYAMKLLRDQIGQWVYPVHRLDKPTSGILLFALHPDIAKQLSHDFEHRLITKTYQAIVRGYPENSGQIDHPLKEIAVFKHLQKSVAQKEPQDALTKYKNLAIFEVPISDGRFPTSRYSLLELQPKTGRKHQLRRHMKHISHPIIGDVKYGKGAHNRLFQEMFASKRLLLAATKLVFTHPVTEEKLELECPLERSFHYTLEKLSEYKTKKG